MKEREHFGELLSACLMAALFAFPALTVQAETTVPTEETTVTEEETLPPQTVPVETLPFETIPVEAAAAEVETLEQTQPHVVEMPDTVAAVTPISRLPEYPAGTEEITIRGVMVLARETDMVVQDDTGGIRMARLPDVPVAPGEILQITGTMEETFVPCNLEKQGTGNLPAVETSLSRAAQALRILLKTAIVREGTVIQGEASIPLVTTEATQGQADVYGVILDGVLYADTIVPVTQPISLKWDWNVYFGLLHAHTEISDGSGSVEEAFAHASRVEGLDFFAVTDHSDSFDNGNRGKITLDGSTVSAEWAAGKRAAAAVTSPAFVGLFGYEMSWSEDKTLGHINTFFTPGWQTAQQPGFATLANYCGALEEVPGSVSQFNHPGIAYGDFHGFREYDPACDRVIQLLEVWGENGESYYDGYLRALDAGWHIAPTVGQNNHHGSWGDEGSGRTAVLAQNLTEDALRKAMQQRRVYATQDADLRIEYRLNGQIMGSVMGLADALEVSARLEDPTDAAIGTVEAITTGGKVLVSRQLNAASGEVTFNLPTGYPYYFLRITQPDGDTAVTAPVWVDSFADMGIRSFSADTDAPLVGQTIRLTLELFNNEEMPFEVNSVTLQCNGKEAGSFTLAEDGRYEASFCYRQAGELRLTAKVAGTVNGRNRSYLQGLTVHYRDETAARSAIDRVRGGEPGTSYHIQGYATSGNTNPYTTFPDSIYVQDTSGGIRVAGTFALDIQVGTPLDVTGVLRETGGEKYLELTACTVSEGRMYRFVPKTQGCKAATDYVLRGGSLVQVEGEAVSVEKTADGKGVSRLKLRDVRGDTAWIVVDPEIRSGAYGVNHLASQIRQGRTVRAIGLLSRDGSGASVIRVRNCDEVVYVPPVPDRTNPQTGDVLLRFFHGS